VYSANPANPPVVQANASPLRLLSSGKSKKDKRPWTDDEKEQTSPKKKKGATLIKEKKTKTPP